MVPLTSRGEISTAPADLSPRALVIDDEPLVRWAMLAGLRHAGFDAVAAADTIEARRLARATPRPVIVLLDMGRWAAETRLLLDDLRRSLPQSSFVLLVTVGLGAAVPRGEGITVLPKPFDLADVIRLANTAAIALPAAPAAPVS